MCDGGHFLEGFLWLGGLVMHVHMANAGSPTCSSFGFPGFPRIPGTKRGFCRRFSVIAKKNVLWVKYRCMVQNSFL